MQRKEMTTVICTNLLNNNLIRKKNSIHLVSSVWNAFKKIEISKKKLNKDGQISIICRCIYNNNLCSSKQIPDIKDNLTESFCSIYTYQTEEILEESDDFER